MNIIKGDIFLSPNYRTGTIETAPLTRSTFRSGKADKFWRSREINQDFVYDFVKRFQNKPSARFPIPEELNGKKVVGWLRFWQSLNSIGLTPKRPEILSVMKKMWTEKKIKYLIIKRKKYIEIL